MNARFRIGIFLAAVAFAACSDAASSGDADVARADTGTADGASPNDASPLSDSELSADSRDDESFGITNLAPYQVVEGIVDVEVATGSLTPAHVSLVVEGQEVTRDEEPPFVLRWDTTRFEDGLVWARAEAPDTQSESVMLMVLNRGQRIDFGAGATSIDGTLAVSSDGSFDSAATDYPWQLPDGYGAIMMLLFWDNPLFELQFDVGQGADSRGGVFVTGGGSNMSPANLWYSLTHRYSALAPGDCYVAISPRNGEAMEIRGEATPFRLEGYLLR